ncbi:hypothetical protein [Muribaculum intestinale]|uniref:hypothetical protein n=1 Tax=Muribaculum intestinale TaxID=1796646 RepID=UPI0024308985|nr:hypothetical protein [Muribaculum intestinale]
MNLIDYKGFNNRKDIIMPFYIGNFLHTLSSKAEELMADAAIILKDLGWENEFIIYHYEDRQYVRLYLRVAYVSAFHIDGKWDEIRTRLPKIITLLKATVELRKENNIELLWIEKEVKKLQWTSLDAPCIFCETYKTDNNLL